MAAQEPPGTHWPEGQSKPKAKIESGHSPPGVPVLEAIAGETGEAGHTLVVQINAADFHNKHVGKMLRDVWEEKEAALSKNYGETIWNYRAEGPAGGWRRHR